MKKFQTLVCLLALTLCLGAQAQRKDGRQLVNLWNDYDKLEYKDLPKDQLKILEKIRKEAYSKRLSWDYYEAVRLEAMLQVGSNWKLRDNMDRKRIKNLEAYGEPILIVYDSFRSNTLSRDTIPLSYIEEHASKLKEGHNISIYSQIRPFSQFFPFANSLAPLFRNDYDFVQWCIAEYSSSKDLQKSQEYFSGRYPLDALLEYRTIGSRDTTAFEAYAKKYLGRAVGYLAEEKLIKMRWSTLLSIPQPKEEDFVKLSKDCKEFKRNISKYSGFDDEIVKDLSVELIDENINKKDVYIDVSPEGILSCYVRNIPELTLTIKRDGKRVSRVVLNNPHKHLFIQDTLTWSLPQLEDGDYEIQTSYSSFSKSFEYNKRSISMVFKNREAVYIADYQSGKPLDSCTISQYKNDKLLRSKKLKIVDAFTPLPSEFFERGTKLIASYTNTNGQKRLSDSYYDYSSPYTTAHSQNNSISAIVLSDKAAYTPKEIVYFKVILHDNNKVCPNIALEAQLFDARGKLILSKELVTNDYGSASSQFSLDDKLQPGLCSIRIQTKDNKWLGEKSIRVDEFVLPSMSLVWEKPKENYLIGDTVSVRGKITSYSGHPLNSIKAWYTVKNQDFKTICDGEKLDLDSNGVFEIKFLSDNDMDWSYSVSVKVVDSTGETLEWDTHLYLNSLVSIETEFLNNLDAKVKSDDNYCLLFEDSIELDFKTDHPNTKIHYSLLRESKEILSGDASAGKHIIDLSGQASGLYLLRTEARRTNDQGKEYRGISNQHVYIVSSDTKALFDDVDVFFRRLEPNSLNIQAGTTKGPVWLVCELTQNTTNKILAQKIVKIDGIKGEPSSLQTTGFEPKEEYQGELRLHFFFIKADSFHDYGFTVNTIEKPKAEMPLSFIRFLDTAQPGKQYQFTIQTSPGAECAVSIFDASTESIMSNVWNEIVITEIIDNTDSYFHCPGLNDIILWSGYGRKMFAMANDSSIAVEESVAISGELSLSKALGSSDASPTPVVRSDFATSLAWEPSLRPNPEGIIELNFRTADKLTRFNVQLFAHDKDMVNTSLRREMTVTLPVRVAIEEPRYLYDSDIYTANITLSNSSPSTINGQLYLEAEGGNRSSRQVELAAGQSSILSVDVPIPTGIDKLALSLGFIPDNPNQAGDAMAISIPILKSSQILTEAHSAIVREQSELQKHIDELRSQFININGAQASVRQISIRQMLDETLLEARQKLAGFSISEDVQFNAISLSEALRTRAILGEEPDSALVQKLKDCITPEGGFAWFAGMKASPVVTSAVLINIIKSDTGGELTTIVSSAAQYLDRIMVGKQKRAIWLGGISLSEYAFVRSLCPGVELNYDAAKKQDTRKFLRSIRNCLLGKKPYNAKLSIYGKSLRIETIDQLLASNSGLELAEKWKISKAALKTRANNDVASLVQYAQPHKSGGSYFPNAVLPYRGLLETELYAHVQLCQILERHNHSDIAEGLRLWIMLQKETQNWQSDPAYLAAIECVMHGSEQTLGTNIVVLEASEELPFEQVRPSGNGMRLEVEYYRDGRLLSEADTLYIGDKISAKYKIWSEENRSFVRLSVPRNAALRPVNQLSSVSQFFAYESYKSVRAEHTEYWMEVLPEEDRTITEDFFVTQQGRFQAAAAVIESLYATHYRANTAYSRTVTANRE